jgi:phosphoglycerate kinase
MLFVYLPSIFKGTFMKNALRTFPIQGKTVLLRVDMNVPMKEGRVTDDTRIVRVLPTIQGLVARGAKVVLLSHFGRPEGKRVASMSLLQIAETLRAGLVGITLHTADDCIGQNVKNAIANMQAGEVLLCENLRFHAEEEQGDAAFAKQLASLGDLYINDAFSCSHRAHASISGIAEYLPAYFGDSMLEEITALEAVFTTPARPVAALVGGSKVSTKMALLENLVETMDILMIGGGMANTFLFAQGHAVGKSLCEPDLKELALSIMKKAADHGCRILLPEDVVVAKAFASHAPCRVVGADAIAADDMALDVGSATISAWGTAIAGARTLVWNGPVGAFETAPFDNSTVFLARIIAAQVAKGELACVAGGGDTVSALAHAGLTDAMTYVSTAGGAFLEWLEGKPLAGVDAINKQTSRLVS